MKHLKIGALASLSEVPAKTIRFYEEIGLLPTAYRTSNGYRAYDQSDVERLAFIRRCRELQIPLEQVKQLVHVRMDKKAPCQKVDRMLAEHLEKVRRTIAELTLLEKTLCVLSESCDFDVVSDCRILHQLSDHDAVRTSSQDESHNAQ